MGAKIFGIFTAIMVLMLVSLSPAADKLNFATSFKGPQFDMLGLAMAEKGFWKQNALEIQWLRMQGSTPTNQALVAGSLDVAMDVAPSAIQAVTRGLPIIILADTKFAEDWMLWVKKDGPIKEGKDLKGGKVGTSRFGGAASAYGLVLLKGLGIEKEAKMVAVGGLAERVAALKAGAIDAFPLGATTAMPLKVKGEIHELINMRPLLPQEWADLMVVSRRDYVAKNPDIVRRAIRAIFQAAEFVQKDREWTLQKLVSYSLYSEEAAKEVYNLLRYGKDGKIDRRALENVQNFLVKYGVIPKEKAVPVESLYTTAFTG